MAQREPDMEYPGTTALMQPVLSVRIITYNHRNFIGPCIESVLMQQTDFPFEIVIGEDNSSDGTREICIEYAKQYPDKIRLILRNEKNKISIEGKKTGRYNFIETIKACRGTFIATLDGDDYWTDPLKLQKQVNFLSENNSYVLTMHDAKQINANGRTLTKSLLAPRQKKDADQLDLRKCFGVITSTLCFRNLVLEFPPEFYRVMIGDTFLISLLAQFGKGKYLSGIRPSAYRHHRNSMYSSLSPLSTLKFSRLTALQMMNYYKRINEPDLERYFSQQVQALSSVIESPYKRFFYSFKQNLFLIQLYFLGDWPRKLLHHFNSSLNSRNALLS